MCTGQIASTLQVYAAADSQHYDWQLGMQDMAVCTKHVHTRAWILADVSNNQQDTFPENLRAQSELQQASGAQEDSAIAHMRPRCEALMQYRRATVNMPATQDDHLRTFQTCLIVPDGVVNA